jgi:hypothetical protein
MTKSREHIAQWMNENFIEDEGVLFADGFDSAFLGISQQAGSAPVAAYDIDECIRVLRVRDGMTREEAEEFFSFNTLCAYVGERTPVFIQRMKPSVERRAVRKPQNTLAL